MYWWKATPESPKMFDNAFIDAFSRIPAIAVPIVFLPIISALVWMGAQAQVGWLTLIAQFAAGFTVWTFTEYWLHRTLFHWIPETPWGERMHFLLHGVHHNWPEDKYRLVMPPAASLGLAVVFFGMYWAIAQLLAPVLAPSWVFAFFAGKILGYVNYDMTHYYVHHFRPKSRWMRQIRSHHLKHHSAAPDAKFGVSFLFWDRVHGTMERPEGSPPVEH